MTPSHAGDMTEVWGCEEMVQEEFLKFNECPFKISQESKTTETSLLIPESLWQE